MFIKEKKGGEREREREKGNKIKNFYNINQTNWPLAGQDLFVGHFDVKSSAMHTSKVSQLAASSRLGWCSKEGNLIPQNS